MTAERIKSIMSDIRSFIGKVVEEEKDGLVGRLASIGDRCVAAARTNGSYTDQTGNLRSSVGYVVTRDGVIVASSAFDIVKDGVEGPAKGKSLAADLAAGYPQGYALILVAGMEYAVYVQDKGYDVIDSGVLIADRLINKLNSKRL